MKGRPLIEVHAAERDAIVRDLAAAGPWYDYEYGRCPFCDVESYQRPASDHDISCFWRRAVEWTAR